MQLGIVKGFFQIILVWLLAPGYACATGLWPLAGSGGACWDAARSFSRPCCQSSAEKPLLLVSFLLPYQVGSQRNCCWSMPYPQIVLIRQSLWLFPRGANCARPAAWPTRGARAAPDRGLPRPPRPRTPGCAAHFARLCAGFGCRFALPDLRLGHAFGAAKVAFAAKGGHYLRHLFGCWWFVALFHVPATTCHRSIRCAK